MGRTYTDWLLTRVARLRGLSEGSGGLARVGGLIRSCNERKRDRRRPESNDDSSENWTSEGVTSTRVEAKAQRKDLQELLLQEGSVREAECCWGWLANTSLARQPVLLNDGDGGERPRVLR
jgi:hypothetical protein